MLRAVPVHLHDHRPVPRHGQALRDPDISFPDRGRIPEGAVKDPHSFVVRVDWDLAPVLQVQGADPVAELPEGFRFKGAMAFAGAVMSDSGVPVYGIAPPPQLLFHGIEDKIVNYDKMGLGRWGMFGSKFLVDKVFGPNGYVYSFYRYVGHTHDMAANFVPTWPLQESFLEDCVIGEKALVIDATVDDPAMPLWKAFTLGDLYK